MVHGLGQGRMNLAWDFLPGTALPGKWRQSSKGPGTDVSMWYNNEAQGKQGKAVPVVNH